MPSRSKLRGVAGHGFRVLLFVAIVWLIRDEHLRFQTQQAERNATAVTVDDLRGFFPNAASLSDGDLRRSARDVRDGDGQSLGFVVQTSPSSDRVVGYSGPTNVLIVFGADERILGLRILSSGDTREHVADVKRHRKFLKSFDGMTWDHAARHNDVDAVSGATLTSVAIVEAVNVRLGGGRPSLRFPNEIAVDEVRPFFGDVSRLVVREQQPAVWDCVDATGRVLGSVTRTSPAADAVMGYQGPTDSLIVFGTDGRTRGVVLRSSYDNEPYVGYVRQDSGFWSLFEGQTLEQLAKLNPHEAEIEGVSGATMTSMAVANGLPKAAQHALDRREPTAGRVSVRDVGTVAVVLFGLALSVSSWRSHRRLRIVFQLTLVLYLGFMNGDLLSQALLVGWAQSGIPWSRAPGLVVLSLAALLVPVVSRRQPYCQQICPFGAAQQMIRHVRIGQWTLPPWLTRMLSWIPSGLLGVVVWAAMTHADVNLASLEPFDAFVFWIAGGAALTIAVVGLAVSLFVPMAYCRFGCPTGALLNFLRYHSGSGKLTTRDWAALTLVALAALLRWM